MVNIEKSQIGKQKHVSLLCRSSKSFLEHIPNPMFFTNVCVTTNTIILIRHPDNEYDVEGWKKRKLIEIWLIILLYLSKHRWKIPTWSLPYLSILGTDEIIWSCNHSYRSMLIWLWVMELLEIWSGHCARSYEEDQLIWLNKEDQTGLILDAKLNLPINRNIWKCE